MAFSAKWQLRSGLSWQTAVTHLIRELEASGCVIHGNGSHREICVPGLDEQVMSLFQSDFSPMLSDWKTFVQRELWDRAHIQLNSETREVECRWVYWTSFQIAFHLLMAAIFFGTGCRVEWSWILFVPTVFALSDAHKLRRTFSLWHAKCSIAPTEATDRLA